MEEASAASEDSTAGTGPKLNGSKGKGLGTKGIISIIMVAALLVAIPLGYIVLTSEDASPPEDEGEDETVDFAVLVTGKTGESELNLTDLQGMTYVEAVSSYQNRFLNYRGLGTYGGVQLRDIADLVGGMAPGDIMTIEGSDGYVQNLSYYQVYPDAEYLAVQGKSILSYKFNGTAAPDWEDGPMIAILAPDQAYSNADFNATCARDPEFLTSTSASSIWVRTVANITISEKYDEWSITMEDLDGTEKVLTRTKFVWLAFSFGDYYVDSYQRNWSGVPMENVLGLIDDDDPSAFNQTMAAKGYRVNISDAADGLYYKILDVDYLLDDVAILADKMNGTALEEDAAPLRLVGPSLSKKEWVSGIAFIGLLDPIVLTMEDFDSTIDLTMDEVMAMVATTGDGGFIKETKSVVGPNEYTGVRLKDLVDLVNDSAVFSIEVVAEDGWEMIYGYDQVDDGEFDYYDPISGEIIGTGDFDMILAYKIDGEPFEDMNFRIAIVDESAPITESDLWAKMVRTINVIEYVEDWEITVNGVTSKTIDRQTFEAIASCPEHQLSYTFVNGTGVEHTYTGVALWVLVSAVDGADGPDNEYLFNDLLAQAQYNVTVTCGEDGYNKSFSSMQVARNDTLIVANKLDGVPLADDHFPLRLVGAGLRSGQMVYGIAYINFTDYNSIADWSVWLNGTRDVQMSAATFVSTYYSTLHGPYFNYTDYGGWHAAYYNYTDDLEVDHTYTGIPLWMLVSCVDGEDLDHYQFNETLATQGYAVKITASDGWSVTLTSAEVEYNDTLVIAFMFDWELLAEDKAPLRLVSQWLSKSMWISQIVSIELIGV
jgi:DMSO/TMAO reductase YedYZ molybdopterin-dependent catalytic subunit